MASFTIKMRAVAVSQRPYNRKKNENEHKKTKHAQNKKNYAKFHQKSNQ